jgi:hypothetical protein
MGGVSAPVRLAVSAVIALALTAATYLPVCGLVYRCGCTWFFAGGSAKCNIHNPAPPHCPACTSHLAGLRLGVALAAPAFVGSLLLLRRRGR